MQFLLHRCRFYIHPVIYHNFQNGFFIPWCFNRLLINECLNCIIIKCLLCPGYELYIYNIQDIGIKMERIQSDEYFAAVKAYFIDHYDPARVYKFLLDTLREDEYKLSEEMFYRSVDTLETTDGCMRFYIGTECIFMLCSNPK
jgi:hypothetical protein